MLYAFVLNPDRTPSDMVHPSDARRLLNEGKAAVFKRFPFTLILKEAIAPTQEYRIKIDPGSKVTGFALLCGDRVVWAAELTHRGLVIKKRLESRAAIRRNRRSRKTRYRAPRFDNRKRGDKWLPPSLMSRVYNTLTWVHRIQASCNLTAISLEWVKFDMQKMQNPEISGIEYQRGELFGYEVRAYLQEKFRHRCAYCDAPDWQVGVEFNIDHIIPRSKYGSDRVSNLAWCCRTCNEKKGNKMPSEIKGKFGDRVQNVVKRAKAPLRDAAAVNATRKILYWRLRDLNLSVEAASGGTTKFNRAKIGVPKAHWIDAACVGRSTPDTLSIAGIKPLLIKATGHGIRQMMQTDKYGFPKGKPRPRSKYFADFRTGDIAIASIPSGKNVGFCVGRVTIRFRNSFAVGKADGIHPKYLTRIHRADGYEYSYS